MIIIDITSVTAEVLVQEVERLKTTERFKGLKVVQLVVLNIAKKVEKCEILVESHLLQFQKA